MAGQGRKSWVLVPVPGSMRMQCAMGHSLCWSLCWRRQQSPASRSWGHQGPGSAPQLPRAVPAHAPSCPQSLQAGMGPGLAPGGPSQRNRRNNVPMRTSAFYFLPTMFSWQTRHSHDRGLGSKPRAQHDRLTPEAHSSTQAQLQAHREAPTPSSHPQPWAPGGFGARCPQG